MIMLVLLSFAIDLILIALLMDSTQGSPVVAMRQIENALHVERSRQDSSSMARTL
jgi:hypothetical protein